MKINLKKVRLSFPDLFTAKAFEEGGTATYGCTLLVEPDSANDKAIRNAMKAAAEEKWGVKHAPILKAALASNNGQKVCFWSGDTKEYDGYAGMMALTAKRNESKGRPLVIDRDKSPLVEADGRPYAGCFVNASVEIWPQDNKYGKTLRCELLGVQFAADGDAFSAGSVADEADFDDLSDSGDADDLA